MAFPPVLFISRRLLYLLRVCNRLLGRNLAQQNMSLETPVIIASLLPEVLENAQLIQKFDHSCIKYNTGFIVALDQGC